MNYEDFNFSVPIQVRWNDLDALGHVNNAVFVTYFEIARGYFMLAATKNWDWQKDMFLIGNINVNYQKELLLTAKEVKVHIKTSSIGNKSFILEYAITSIKNDKMVVHAVGTTTQIMFDMISKSTIEVPDWVRKDLIEFDNLDVS